MARGITVLAVGGKHDSDLKSAIERFERRLSTSLPITWQLLPYSSHKGDQARRAESADMLAKLKARDYVVLLDETGSQLSSEAFSQHLFTLLAQPYGRIVFIIGGAYGVDQTVKSRADLIWSLSSLVFPHQLVRLLLVEQLYRAQTISDNHPYHHQ